MKEIAETIGRLIALLVLKGILTDTDKKKIVDVLENAKARFTKRLESWWKRYGAQGLHVWTYYSD